MTTAKKASEMSTKELEALLNDKKKEEKARAIAEREGYVKNRDAMILNLVAQAKQINALLTKFSETAHLGMIKQKERLDAYGMIRANSKGGFQIMTEDQSFKIKYAYSAIGDYDERANKAEELLKDFLADMVKKPAKGPYKIIQSLLERNKAGQLEYSRISSLYKYEGDYDDPRWKEAIKLFKESFIVKGSKMQPMFYENKGDGKWELINLNFSSI
jgi:hypothetical protein